MTPAERKASRLVCREWNDIFITAPEFKSERVLPLRGCSLHPDEEPFLSIREGYLQYFNRVKIGLMVKIDPKCDEYWLPIASHVKELEVDMRQVSKDNINLFPVDRYGALLAGMPSLKRLDIKNVSSYYVGFMQQDFIEELNKRQAQFEIEELNLGLYKIHTDSLELMERIKEWLPKFFKCCKNLKRVKIDNLHGNFQYWFSNLIEMHKDIEFFVKVAPNTLPKARREGILVVLIFGNNNNNNN